MATTRMLTIVLATACIAQPGGRAARPDQPFRHWIYGILVDIVAESQWTVNIFTISCICAQKQYVNFRSQK